MVAFLIFIGAGIGGVARYAVGAAVGDSADSAFPWATFAINVSGSLLLGLLSGLLGGIGAAAEWRAFLGVGVLGGFTTFSTFGFETLRFAQSGHWERALLYAVGSVALAVGGALLGLRLASLMLSRG